MSFSLKDRLALVVDQLCKQSLQKDGEGWTAKPEFVNALCVVVEDLCGGPFQEDLTAFAHHAKRKTVGPEDVRLLVRKSPQLVNRLDKFISDDGAAAAAAKRPKKQSKRSPPTTTTTISTTTNRSNFLETSSSSGDSEQSSQSDNEEEELFKD